MCMYIIGTSLFASLLLSVLPHFISFTVTFVSFGWARESVHIHTHSLVCAHTKERRIKWIIIEKNNNKNKKKKILFVEVGMFQTKRKRIKLIIIKAMETVIKNTEGIKKLFTGCDLKSNRRRRWILFFESSHF